MKTLMAVAGCLLCLCLAGTSGRTPAQGEKRKREHYHAVAFRMGGAGATPSVDLYIDSYTTNEEAKRLSGMLLDSGPDALLKALADGKRKGKITLTGRVGFYDFKLVRSWPTETGRRIIAVGDRPITFLETYNSTRSKDYNFGILMVDLTKDKKGKEKGEGVLIYAAKVKLLEGNKLDIENYGINPVRLMGVRQLK
ncbi:MAG TPA: hypothetical protein VIW80_14105 [Pyrinomonadaceae bacterium]